MNNPFPISLDTIVVTSDYVTQQGMPVLYVCREVDCDEEIWQFHCGNGDCSMQHMQLVRLEVTASGAFGSFCLSPATTTPATC